MSRRPIPVLPQWLRTATRVTAAAAVLLAVPGVAIPFAISAYQASNQPQPPQVSALTVARTGVGVCPARDVWSTAPNGRGIRVNLAGLSTPKAITVTVVHDTDQTAIRTKAPEAGHDSLEVDFHKLHADAIDGVFMQTGPDDRCEIDSAADNPAPATATPTSTPTATPSPISTPAPAPAEPEDDAPETSEAP